MTFTTIAIFGATGNVGKSITKAILAKEDFKVKIFTRPDTLENPDKKALFDGFRSSGAQIVGIDIKNVDEVAKELEGTQVVLSNLSGIAVGNQELLIKAAQKAGVKRFYPSEYGIDDIAHKISSPFIDPKKAIRTKIIDAGIESVIVVTGFFLEWQVSPAYSFNAEDQTVEIFGNGNTKISFTSLGDIGTYVAESINHPQLQGSSNGEYILRVPKVHASLNEIIAIHAAATGKPFKATYVDIKEAEKKVGGIVDWIRLWQAQGLGVVESNFDIPTFKPKSFSDLFN